jgi:hypothetical protein
MKPRTRLTPEGELKRGVMDFLALQPDCVIVRVFCGKVKAEHGGWIHGAPNGTADFLGHCAGVPVALELKSKRGKRSEEQTAFAEKWTKAGGVCLLVKTLDDVAWVLRLCRDVALTRQTDGNGASVRGGGA